MSTPEKGAKIFERPEKADVGKPNFILIVIIAILAMAAIWYISSRLLGRQNNSQTGATRTGLHHTRLSDAYLA